MANENLTPEESYAEAQRLIAKAKEGDDVVLNFGIGNDHLPNLTRLPPEISALTGLLFLILNNTQIEGDSLRHLAGLTGLNTLILDNT